MWCMGNQADGVHRPAFHQSVVYQSTTNQSNKRMQCMGELMEYTDQLDKAAATEDPYER